MFLYLIDFREETTPYELAAEIIPEVQLADTGTAMALVFRIAGRICALVEKGDAAGLGGHHHIRYPCDLTYKVQRQIADHRTLQQPRYREWKV